MIIDLQPVVTSLFVTRKNWNALLVLEEIVGIHGRLDPDQPLEIPLEAVLQSVGLCFGGRSIRVGPDVEVPVVQVSLPPRLGTHMEP